MTNLVLVAPLQGWVAPLDEVPDGAFAGRMLGDGVAIDPTCMQLCAPCDGEIIAVAAQKHAVTVRADNGAEILLHVGIDTVALAGEGFELLARLGQRVRCGEALLRFDLDLLARRATSVLTPIVLIGDQRFELLRRECNREVAVGDFLMELAPVDAAREAQLPAAGREVRIRLTVPFEHGIHARPAAALAGRLKGLSADVRLLLGERSANGRSATSLMALGARKGDEVSVIGTGRDAAAAIAALQDAFQPDGHEVHSAPKPVPFAAPSAPTDGRLTHGVIASPGIAVGTAVRLTRPEIPVNEHGMGVEAEHARFDRACSEVRERLRARAASERGSRREIIEAHLEFLDDPELAAATREAIAQGKSAAYAWKSAVRSQMSVLRSLGDARLSERGDDLLDLESQLLAELTGTALANAPPLPERAIVLARDLLPSQLVALNADRLAGICTAEGGATSHVAILAAAMQVPMLVAAGERVLEIPADTPLVLDAEHGRLNASPTAFEWEEAQAIVLRTRARRATELAEAYLECHTLDGTRVELYANVGSVAEARTAVAQGAEGCGLLRTEFLFLERAEAPDESEQSRQYSAIAAAFAGRPVVIRTLDVGGDKPLRYLPLPAEENPALGVRGIRASLLHPELMRTQLRAILKATPAGVCRILLPMVSDSSELRAVRSMLDGLRAELQYTAPVSLGAMIETPAAALMADQLAREADFLSIGTNDLTQYTLAMDRGNAALAGRLDALHPAVLRLIARVTHAAGEHGRHVAVCGSLASETAAVPLLIGLGVHELSMVPAAIARMKSLIRTLTSADCAAVAREALVLADAAAIRALVQRWLAKRVPLADLETVPS